MRRRSPPPPRSFPTSRCDSDPARAPSVDSQSEGVIAGVRGLGWVVPVLQRIGAQDDRDAGRPLQHKGERPALCAHRHAHTSSSQRRRPHPGGGLRLSQCSVGAAPERKRRGISVSLAAANKPQNPSDMHPGLPIPGRLVPSLHDRADPRLVHHLGGFRPDLAAVVTLSERGWPLCCCTLSSGTAACALRAAESPSLSASVRLFYIPGCSCRPRRRARSLRVGWDSGGITVLIMYDHDAEAVEARRVLRLRRALLVLLVGPGVVP